MNNDIRRVVLAIIALVVLIGLAQALGGILSNRRVIVVSTDTTPVKLQLNDRVYNLNKKNQKLTVKPGQYDYRATGLVDGKEFNIESRLNLTDDKKVGLTLNYKVYTKQSVADSICQNGDEFACNIKPSLISVVYLEGQQWAVASVHEPNGGVAKAVLRINNGRWMVLEQVKPEETTAEPATTPPGYYPQSVEEAFQNGQN